MTIDSIYLDLDECLVSTIYKPNGAPRNRILIELENSWLGKKEKYYSQLRPGALEFIEYCRNIAPTFILTAAATDYAQEHNKVLNLGFSDDQILGRSFYCYHRSGMFHDSIINTKVDYAPNSILVDNQNINHYGSENLKVKMRFLGIKEDRLVKSREYTGGKQPPSFDKEIKQIENILLVDGLRCNVLI
jgi:hypothetical protein